ncbi:hypothetical protein [Acinetobacter nosocomialis]|uniref:hypothetical protein n=1 Tax=Acinetobacter nosocomialis TaxID=106654 RepID=UPI00124FEED5|nr:hypothetical protein [Acinetobacter nosocomialis]
MSEFKVGDKITTLLCDDILTVIGIGHGHFLKAKGFNCHGMIDGECNVLSFQVKHATPEEIAAGHRIDNDLGDDFPIENRISPLCEVKDHEAK